MHNKCMGLYGNLAVRAFEDVKREEARRQGIALGNYRTRLSQQALQRNIGTITAAKCGQWFRFMQTYCICHDASIREAIEG